LLTPNYHVQKMFSVNEGDIYFDHVIAISASDTTIFSSCVKDTRTGDLILKLVNTGSSQKNIKIDLSRFKKINTNAEKIVLAGMPDDENTFDAPQVVMPTTSEFKVSKTFEYTAPSMSLTVIRIKS